MVMQQKENAEVRFNPLPAPGDFVWCWFPETLGEPGPKARVALVIGVFDEDGKVRVCYGTSQKTEPEKIFPGEFVMDPADDGYDVSGLGARTKFDLSRRFDLPFTSRWFKVNLGTTVQVPLPKMGTLAASYYPALQKALESIK